MTVLAGREIERRVRAGEECGGQIFRPGSWDPAGIRPAAYDLRIAADFLILPDGTRYGPNSRDDRQLRRAPFYIEPEEVAFVSTVEEFCMPFDLAGNIAPRFRTAMEGILVMGGMLVDPGYHGRLHFQLANIGDEPYRIEPGRTSVSAMQILRVKGARKKAAIVVRGSDDLLEELFEPDASEPLPPLTFFSKVKGLATRLDTHEVAIDQQRIKLDSTSRSMDQLLVFGVFLVSITLFTVAIGVLIDAIAGGAIEDAGDTVAAAELTLPGLAVAVVLLAVVGTACWLMMRPVAKIVRERNPE